MSFYHILNNNMLLATILGLQMLTLIKIRSYYIPYIVIVNLIKSGFPSDYSHISAFNCEDGLLYNDKSETSRLTRWKARNLSIYGYACCFSTYRCLTLVNVF